MKFHRLDVHIPSSYHQFCRSVISIYPSALYKNIIPLLLFELLNPWWTAGLFFWADSYATALKGVNLLVGWHLALSFAMLESVMGFLSPCVALYNSSRRASCVSLCVRLLCLLNCCSCERWSCQFAGEERSYGHTASSLLLRSSTSGSDPMFITDLILLLH